MTYILLKLNLTLKVQIRKTLSKISLIGNYSDSISGVSAKLEDIKTGREKKLTAHVLRNVLTVTSTPLTTPYSFFTVHDRFAPASIILEKNVHLLSIDKEQVKYLRFNKDLDILNLRKHPILFLAQLMNVNEVITLPRKEFDRIMNKIDIDDREVVWFFHTIRCGSTVWGQIFDSLPQWTVISESQALYHTVVYARKEVDISAFSKTKEYEDMVVAAIKSYVRMAPKGHSIFWKTAPVDDHMLEVIRRRFPCHKILFGYRNALPCALSFEKAFGWLPSVQRRLRYVMNAIANVPPSTGEARVGWLFHTQGYNPDLTVKAVRTSKLTFNTFEWFVLLWAIKITMIQEFEANGGKFKPIKYESLMKNPREVISGVFDYVNVPKNFVETALKTMECDSQAGLFFSHKNRASFKSWQRSNETVQRCNDVLKVFDLPSLDSSYTIPF